MPEVSRFGPRNSLVRGVKRLLFPVIPVVALLVSAEVLARAYYFYKHGYAVRYLTIPYGFGESETAKVTSAGTQVGLPEAAKVTSAGTQVVLPYRPERTYTQFDSCALREITFMVNAQGGRGRDWPTTKAPGTVRILALGGSTTFGAYNPDDWTWPAQLQGALTRRYGAPVEVLNGGQPGAKMEEVLQTFSDRWLPYRPDVVIYYGAYNNTLGTAFGAVDLGIHRFHRYSGIGRLGFALYNRSMLYTSAVEKLFFFRITRQSGIVPEIDWFRRQVARFIDLVHESGATPILALEKTQFPEVSELRDMGMDDPSAIQRVIVSAAGASGGSPYDRITLLRSYQTQVLVEVGRQTAQERGVAHIDPRPAFAEARAGMPLFCDEVHLTDRGNQVLAEAMAERLDLGEIVRSVSKTK